MDKLMFALMVASWIGVVICVPWLCLAVHSTVTYEGSWAQKLDRANGITTEWPVRTPFLISVISIVWLITYYFG